MTATDQRTAYYSDDPRRVIEACGPVPEAVLRAFVAQCRAMTNENYDGDAGDGSNVRSVEISVGVWCDPNGNGYQDRVPLETRASILRCLIAPPQLGERAECPQCKGEGVTRVEDYGMAGHQTCSQCCGRKTIAILFVPDPRWLSCDVLMLATVIRGGPEFCPDCEGAGEVAGGYFSEDNMMMCPNEMCRDGLIDGIPPDLSPERFPILADALMDAGCDSEEIIGHLRSGGPHVHGCWVIGLLTGGK